LIWENEKQNKNLLILIDEMLFVICYHYHRQIEILVLRLKQTTVDDKHEALLGGFFSGSRSSGLVSP
jgi:hypothetical protein